MRLPAFNLRNLWNRLGDPTRLGAAPFALNETVQPVLVVGDAHRVAPRYFQSMGLVGGYQAQDPAAVKFPVFELRPVTAGGLIVHRFWAGYDHVTSAVDDWESVFFGLRTTRPTYVSSTNMAWHHYDERFPMQALAVRGIVNLTPPISNTGGDPNFPLNFSVNTPLTGSNFIAGMVPIEGPFFCPPGYSILFVFGARVASSDRSYWTALVEELQDRQGGPDVA